MKRQIFIRLAGVLAAVIALFIVSACVNKSETPASEAGKEIYEWRIYTLTGDGVELDNYLKDMLIPAYNRKGVMVGAFKPYIQEEQETRHVLFIYPDIRTYHTVSVELWDDAAFRSAARGFFDATAPNPLYSNIETFISEAFAKIPVHRTPESVRTLFEFRIYWSPNEEANKRKIKMFNEDEIDLFDVCGINSVLYGDILAGPRMPALMYLTWHKDEATRTEAWSAFSAHPDWQRIRRLPEYANTATNNRIMLLSPMPYSQL